MSTTCRDKINELLCIRIAIQMVSKLILHILIIQKAERKANNFKNVEFNRY
jgi:hypothetical protein